MAAHKKERDPRVNCPKCGWKIEANTDDNYNSAHTLLVCPVCRCEIPVPAAGGMEPLKCHHLERCPDCMAKVDEIRRESATFRVEVMRLRKELKDIIYFQEVRARRIRQLEKAVDEMPNWIALIKAERARQDAKWGEQNHDDFKWLSILVEEVGEVAKAILEGDPKGVEEVVHCAAVCAQWIDAIRRRAGG